MPTNDFLAFATAPGANVITQGDYVADPIVPAGFASGLLPSAKTNKIWRQASFVAASVAQLIQDTLSVDVLDNGDVGTFSDNLASTIQALAGGGSGHLTEAPADGDTYGRRMEAWAPVVLKAGDTMSGYLSLTLGPLSAEHAANKGYVDAAMATRAPITSPIFSGTPVAPTAPTSTNTTQIATCAFVMTQVAAATAGVSSITAGAGIAGGGTGVVTLSVATGGVTSAMLAQMPARTVKGNMNTGVAAAADVPLTTLLTTMGAAPTASPVFSGTPTAPTAAAGTNTTQLATTQFVATAVAAIGTTTKINLASGVSGILPVASGGTGSNTAAGAATNLNVLPLTGGNVAGNFSATRITVTGGGLVFDRDDQATYWEWHASSNWAALYSGADTQDELSVFTDGTVAARTTLRAPTVTVVGPSGSYMNMTDDGESHIDAVNVLRLNSATQKPVYIGGDVNTDSHWIYTTSLIASSRVQAAWEVVPGTDNTGGVGDVSQAWAQMNCYWYNTVSGRDKKQDIATAPPGALESVNALRAVHFRWRQQPFLTDPATTERPSGSSPPHRGFIADEVAGVFGEDWGGYSCVEDADGTRHEAIAYDELVAVLWQAVQELSAKVTLLEQAGDGAADQ